MTASVAVVAAAEHCWVVVLLWLWLWLPRFSLGAFGVDVLVGEAVPCGRTSAKRNYYFVVTS